MTAVIDKRYQVFVSSTYTDLIEERRQVTEQLLRLRCIPSGMELFTASGQPPWNVIEAALETTDYMVLILAGRYGSVSNKDGRSYTEREYDHALELGIPVLAFLHAAPKRLPAEMYDTGALGKKRDAFWTRVRDSEQHTVDSWSDARDLAQKVALAIPDAIRTQPRPGWIRESYNTDRQGDRSSLAALQASSASSTSDQLRQALTASSDVTSNRIPYGLISPSGTAQALASTYYPEPPTDMGGEVALFDLRLRGAGALPIAPEASERILLGSALRQELKTVVDDSNLVRWAEGLHPSVQVPWWRPEVARADRWRESRQVSRRYAPERVSVAVEARVEPSRLSWSVDIDITDPQLRENGALMSAEDMVRGWLELARLVGPSLLDRAAKHLALPPVLAPEVVLWAMPARHDLGRLLGLSRLPHDVESRPLADSQLLLSGAQLADLEHSLLFWLQRILLDDGVTNAEEISSSLLDRAVSRPVDSPWL